MQQFESTVLGAMNIAQAEALEKKHWEIKPMHVLYGLLKVPGSFTAKKLGKLISEVKQDLKKLPQSPQKLTLDQIKSSVELSEWITKASSNAIQKGRQENLLQLMMSVF